MKFQELKERIGEYVHNEDDGLLRIALASVIATRMKLGEPVWMLVVGPSSGGKSQLLRPLALTDTAYIHRVDDLTENTLLSGQGSGDNSLLKKIGSEGIIVVSDLTVIFSKNAESRNAILSQLRMVYDGEMVKHVGNSGKPIAWKGSVGFLAGSTPSVYGHFEEVADMGERFICYRMKPYDVEKATRRSLARKVFGRELDNKLGDLYAEYIKNTVQEAQGDVPVLCEEDDERILQLALFAARLRTPVHYDKYLRQPDRVPIQEAPMRIALQLRSIALGLSVMRLKESGKWRLTDEDFDSLAWCAYSLSNEERRSCIRVMSEVEYKTVMRTSYVADRIGLSTEMTRMHLQHLAAIGIVERTGDSDSLAWGIKEQKDYDLFRRLEGIDGVVEVVERQTTQEDGYESGMSDEAWDNLIAPQ